MLTPTDQALLEKIRQRLASGQLPGPAAQALKSPPLRGTPTPPEDARKASVLALLYPIEEILHLLFIQRTSPKRDRHAGQISFPGGAAEANDSSPAITALRETEEEVGIPRRQIQLLGALSQLYIPVSNFLVDPFVGFTAERPTFQLQESEVARTLELPFADFLQQNARQVGNRLLSSGYTLPETPYWGIKGEEIWGATSMMVAELVALVRE
ncbi:MAG: CoA pyrophosphatase [Bacteroidota bacterium]